MAIWHSSGRLRAIGFSRSKTIPPSGQNFFNHSESLPFMHSLFTETLASLSEMTHLFGWKISPIVASIIAAVFHAAVLIHLFALIPMIFIWTERKVSGRIQDRLGPTRVGGKFGWLQGLADGVKLIQKEDLVPPAADGMLFRMAPYLACIAVFCAFMVLPFSGTWVAVASDIGLFLLLAILSLEVFGIILAGYSSGSKWSLFGGMREAAQMVSYEIPLAICGLVPIVAVGSLNLAEIGEYQRGGIWNWLMFNNPFTFIAFFVYFTVATAGCKRAPFDLAEAESELVGGFHTEYSGMRWSFFFMAEYAAMFLVSAVAAILFLGGWNTGILVPAGGALIPLEAAFANGLNWVTSLVGVNLGSYFLHLIGVVVILTKASLLVLLQIWVRWTFPRLRIDQVMMTCLKYLIPISCFLFFGAAVWPLILLQLQGKTTIFTPPLGNSVPAAARPVEEAEQTTARGLNSAAMVTVAEDSEAPQQRTKR